MGAVPAGSAAHAPPPPRQARTPAGCGRSPLPRPPGGPAAAQPLCRGSCPKPRPTQTGRGRGVQQAGREERVGGGTPPRPSPRSQRQASPRPRGLVGVYLRGAGQHLAVGRGGVGGLSALAGLPRPLLLPPGPDAPKEHELRPEEGQGRGPCPAHGAGPRLRTSAEAQCCARGCSGALIGRAVAQSPRAQARPRRVPSRRWCMSVGHEPGAAAPRALLQADRTRAAARCAPVPEVRSVPAAAHARSALVAGATA